MYYPLMIRDWAIKLIASEVGTDSTATKIEFASLQVYERLRLQLGAPVGLNAFQALASRALFLTKSQFPELSGVTVTAKGRLCGAGEVESPPNLGENGEVGIILITQMLRLFLALLGEAATVRLMEDAAVRIEADEESVTTRTSLCAIERNYFSPFEDILLEADQLRHVSERLEILADTHDGIDEVTTVAESIRNIATVLNVFTLVRGKASGSDNSVLLPPTTGYVN